MLGIKCFSFLPCNDTTLDYNNIWSMKDNRKKGSCFNGYRVIVFKSSDDYANFIKTHLTLNQKQIAQELLHSSLDKFYNLKTKQNKFANCIQNITSYKTELIDAYDQRFMFNATMNSTDYNVFIESEDASNKSKTISSVSRKALFKFIAMFT